MRRRSILEPFVLSGTYQCGRSSSDSLGLRGRRLLLYKHIGPLKFQRLLMSDFCVPSWSRHQGDERQDLCRILQGGLPGFVAEDHPIHQARRWSCQWLCGEFLTSRIPEPKLTLLSARRWLRTRHDVRHPPLLVQSHIRSTRDHARYPSRCRRHSTIDPSRR